MFGVFRTALALVVVASHLGPFGTVGPYAVFGFYVLSGYLMTTIMGQSYGYTRTGVLRYALNRLLRIYPLYLVALLLSVAVIAGIGTPAARAFHEQLGLDVTVPELFRNLFLVLRIDTETRWVPPAWALTVELFYYAAIGLGLSRHRVVCGAWLVLSLAYTVYMLVGGASFSYRYYTVAAASLPFALGASLHHLQQGPGDLLHWLRAHGALAILVGGYAANLVVAQWVGGDWAEGALFYLNLGLAWLLIAHLATRKSTALDRTDKALGELSYPIYLLHFQAGLLLIWADFGSRGDLTFMVVGGMLTVLLAWLFCRWLEPPIQRLRQALRPVQPARPLLEAHTGKV
jgi:peptidoglycan/LPS O-acetylase OafA/YrhL